MGKKGKCPVTGMTGGSATGGGTSNRDWWPNQVNLRVLHQHSRKSNPMGEGFDYEPVGLPPVRMTRGRPDKVHLGPLKHCRATAAGSISLPVLA